MTPRLNCQLFNSHFRLNYMWYTNVTWLVQVDNWPPRPEYWPLIGQVRSRDLNTGLWLVIITCHRPPALSVAHQQRGAAVSLEMKGNSPYCHFCNFVFTSACVKSVAPSADGILSYVNFVITGGKKLVIRGPFCQESKLTSFVALSPKLTGTGFSP